MNTRTFFRLLAEDQPSVKRWSRVLKPFLTFFSFFYRLGARIHRLLYKIGVLKQRALDRSVVSVGNLTWGGTGKTPLVEYVARFYIHRGKVPLILARGYGEDESKELAHKFPEAIFGIGKDRVEEAKKALSVRSADVIILDDGFQHWAVKRELDIVVINVLNPFGNYAFIPRGVLREPLESLERASLVILNDVNLTSRKIVEELKVKIQAVKPSIGFVEAYHQPLYFH